MVGILLHLRKIPNIVELNLSYMQRHNVTLSFYRMESYFQH